MNQRHRPTDTQLDTMLDHAHLGAWPGPDTNPRVEAFIKEQSMSSTTKPTLKRSTIALIAAGVLGGGGLAAAVTAQLMSRRATIITDDGTEYHVELLDSPEGAGGTWEMDDGTVFGINLIEEDGASTMTVDIDSPNGGTNTVLFDNGAAPTVMVNPGETASIRISEKTDDAKRATFIDENGVEHEVNPSAAAGWIQDDDTDSDD